MNELEKRLSQPLLNRIIELMPKDPPIYLVGGAVRDAFLGKPNYDLDFVTGPEAMKIARKLGDALGAAYFPLDNRRKVARLVIKSTDGGGVIGKHPIRVDLSAYQGADLEADLHLRDFTINAMAVDIHQLDALVDPLNGAADLAGKRLRACSPAAFDQDPIRILRAVRFAVDLELKITTDTLHWMRESVPLLPRVSPERIRDELFRMLAIAHPATSIRILDNLGALGYFVPEVVQLKDVRQSAPHFLDAYDHTVELLGKLETILDILRIDFDPDKADNLSMGLVAIKLGRYRKKLAEHLRLTLNLERPLRGLLFFAALYHDVGKLSTQAVDGDGRIRFFGHEQTSGKLLQKRAEALRLGNLEIERLVTILNHHMRPSLLSHSEEPPSRKAVYHFFRDTRSAGVDICLLSLADMLATYGPTLPQERWNRHLEVVRSLLEAWWEEKDDRVFPPPLVNGDELMDALGISAGPLVGDLLEAIREAQVDHDIHSREDAIKLAQNLLKEKMKTG
jgi:tRNA nucleotidyltransferase/poly(A) polymerase